MKKTITLTLVLLLAVAVLLVGCTARSQQAAPAAPAATPNTTTFTNLYAQDLTLGDDLSVTDDSTLGGIVYLGSTDLTVTDGYQLTPTSSFYHLDSAGAVTMTLVACSTNGQLLVLFGDDDNAITINDTNVRTSDGASKDIGQYDIAVFFCADTEWIEALLLTNS